MRRRVIAAPAMVLIFGTTVFGAAACGGAAENTKADKKTDLEKMRAHAACMRKNGVDVPDPGPDGGPIEAIKPGKEGAKIEEAMRKCRHLMPNGGKPEKPTKKQLAQMREFAQCMRKHGVTNFPDPDPNPSGGVTEPGVDPDDPTFRRAQKACDKGEGRGFTVEKRTR